MYMIHVIRLKEVGKQTERVVYECVQYHKEISITVLFTYMYMQLHVHCNFVGELLE